VPPQRRTPLELTEALLRAHRTQDWDYLRTLFHPDAKIGVFATGGAPEDPERAIQAMRQAHTDGVYSATADRISLLDDDVVMLEGFVRYRVPDGGIAFVERVWLYVIVDGLLHRSAMFKTQNDARAALQSGRRLGA
jgi:hypothetical protein